MKNINNNNDMEVYEMEFYNYAEHKRSVQEESAKRIAAVRKKYKDNLENINFTKKGLQNLENSLINELSEQLLQLRAGFVTTASESLQANKRDLIEQRMAKAPKTQGEQMVQLLQFMKDKAVYESRVATMGVDLEMLNDMAINDDISKDLFYCVQGAMMKIADDEQRMEIRSLKKQDTAMNKIMADINDLERIKNDVNAPIVKIEFADKSMYELVTQKELSNYYFEDKHTEEGN